MNVPPNGFEGLLGDLLKAMGGSSSSAWFDAARALAQSVVSDEEAGFNPDPVSRIQLEALSNIVAMHVSEVTGSTVSPDVDPVNRTAWALAALDSWRARIEPIVVAASQAPSIEVDPEDTTTAMLARFASSMGPMFVGLQVGSTAGHLAERALGSSAFPLPWPGSKHPLIVVRNVGLFAADWSLDEDHVAAFTLARELTAHAVLARPETAARLEALLAASTEAQMHAQQTLLGRLTDEDSPEDLTALLGDPERFLEGISGLEGGLDGPEHDALNAAVTALGGYFDEVARIVADRVVGDAGQLAEAWRRHRTGDAKGDEAAAALFGVDLSRPRVEEGAAFVAGVTERAGFDSLTRLFKDASGLPTPAEIVAPGLWLERTSLPAIDSGPDLP
jgi:putative hydrolase